MVRTEDRERVLRVVEEKRDEVVDLLKRLIRFETPCPPGGNTLPAQRWMARMLEGMGFTVEMFDVFPGEPDVVGVLKGSGGGRSIILNGHMDVAEVRPDEPWRHDPFDPWVEDGRVYGRGAFDMKGGIAAMVMAVASVLEAGYRLRGDVILESVVGEEAGEPGTVRCIERGYRADFAIIPEPFGEIVIGQGGCITVWITVKSPVTLHDGTRVYWLHAGGGMEGASAIEKMVKIIQALQELERHWAVHKRHPMLPPGMTTINPAVIEGGRHPAFIADECRLWCTIHTLPNEDYEEVIREVEDYIRRVAEADLWLRKYPPTFKWGGKSLVKEKGEVFPGFEVREDHPGVQTVAAAHEAVTGREPEISMTSTVGDAGWLNRAGIPCIYYGPGGDLSRAHAVNEYVEVEEVLRVTKVLALTLLDWCGYTR
ncbi:acetylornithine deacetylase [Candidatus Bathyarchaeota archaeon]|nr:MAG: acetylornithine deacetylase [Candidatus Bathyarchaeota archaeon]